jgi:hypothetical protein
MGDPAKNFRFCLYYKLMAIVNDDSRVVKKLEASLIDNARVVIYDHHMFIVKATNVVSVKPALALSHACVPTSQKK